MRPLLIVGLMTGVFVSRGAATDAPPACHILLVGVNEYDPKSGFAKLRFAVSDAEGVAKTFIALGYAPGDITVMTVKRGAKDPALMPTADNILARVDKLTKAVQPGQAVYVGVFGHGFQPAHADAAVFVPFGGDRDRSSTLLPFDRLLARLRSCDAKHVMVTADFCRSESRAANPPAAGGGGQYDLDSVTRPRGLAEARTFTVAMSCSAGEASYESVDDRMGAFSLHLVKGLGGAADADGDGAVTHAELIRFLKREVPKYVKEKWGDDQRPAVSDESNADADWVLVRTPRAPTPAEPGAKAGKVRFIDVTAPTAGRGDVAVARVTLVTGSEKRPLANHPVGVRYTSPGGGETVVPTATDRNGVVTVPVAFPVTGEPPTLTFEYKDGQERVRRDVAPVVR